MTVSTEYLRLLHGSDAPVPEMRMLRAGPVTVLLDGVDLRYVKAGGTELVRRVYTAVRDADWDTVPALISGLTVTEDSDSFRVEFHARHVARAIDFAWRGIITGDEDGRIEVVLDGRAEQRSRYSRIGICLHHPWRETAGASFSARTADGDLLGSFPDLIGPQALVRGSYQPLFPAFDRLDLELRGGGRLLLEFEGDLWEVEDHRNWTDANFKTYSTPISRGTPAPLEVGQTLFQRLLITPVGIPSEDPPPAPIRLTLGAPTGTRVPSVGLGMDHDLHRADDVEAALLASLRPRHFRIEVRLDRDDWAAALTSAQESARRAGSSLEVALMLREEHASSLEDVGEMLSDDVPVDRILTTVAGGRTGTEEETTPARLVDLVRRVLSPMLPDTAFVGGTEIYFAEINRTHPESVGWDGVCFSITPQIHAFTDIDVMENLDAQAETVRSAVALSAGTSIVVSPITLRRRVNFHAAGDPPPTLPGELPDAVDVRQSSLFGSAWTTGSLKYLSEAGARAVTYYESTGWRGVLERVDIGDRRERFRSRPGEVFPLYHPLADAIEWCGAEVLELESSDPLLAVGLAVRVDDDAVRALVANLTPFKQRVVIGPLEVDVSVRRLNEETAEHAALDPERFRRAAETEKANGELSLALWPYEVVRIDPA